MDSKGIVLPVLPLRDIVVFPHMVAPLFVGRDKSLKALEEVLQGECKHLLLVSQKDPTLESPKDTDLYNIGTLCQIVQILKLPDGTIKVLVEGVKRFQVHSYQEFDEFFMADCDPVDEILVEGMELEALTRSVRSQFEQFIKLNRRIPPEVLVSISQIDDPSKLADTIIAHFSLKISEKQELLEIFDVNERLEQVLKIIEGESGILSMEKKIRNRVKKQMEKTQKDYYLNEQMKAIQKELEENDEGGRDEIAIIEKKIKQIKLSPEARQKAQTELKKLKMMNTMSSEANVIRSYLDWLLDVPWKTKKKVLQDLVESEDILNQDHHGLEKVKERILEYLAVQARVAKVRGQILCLVGPPGVGKTSLGQSIARATGRTFVRMSLGGVRDESEIRGHRRTYVGAMPGKIVQGMKKAGTSNPLFLLDEIDKMGNDWRGDPASALLEVLDPEQNGTFNDHYLEVDYDLSEVMFVATANSLNLPQALLDRFEIIRLSGYTEDEKVGIGEKHLIAKQREYHGLKDEEFVISEELLRHVIRYYTREAGVRQLERELAKLSRKMLRNILQKGESPRPLDQELVSEFCGIPRYDYGKIEDDDTIGVTTGLAWTETGGDLLSIEVVAVPGKGKTQITGKLGEVMQESVQAALSVVRARAASFGISSTLFEERDIHLHVPEGATPKDGPSAGIAIATSMVSVLTEKPVSRYVAMTGEITLRGKVLPIGGLKEKLLAAHRGGIKTVLIPEGNRKDLAEIPDNVKEGLTIIPVRTVDEVLREALVG